MRKPLVIVAVLMILAPLSSLAEDCKPGEICPTPGPTYTPTAIGQPTATPEKTLPPPGPTYTPTPIGAATATPEKTPPPSWIKQAYLPVVVNSQIPVMATAAPEAYP